MEYEPKKIVIEVSIEEARKFIKICSEEVLDQMKKQTIGNVERMVIDWNKFPETTPPKRGWYLLLLNPVGIAIGDWTESIETNTISVDFWNEKKFRDADNLSVFKWAFIPFKSKILMEKGKPVRRDND
jgi:hypothetical protein